MTDTGTKPEGGARSPGGDSRTTMSAMRGDCGSWAEMMGRPGAAFAGCCQPRQIAVESTATSGPGEPRPETSDGDR
jgi:hypothetical protein